MKLPRLAPRVLRGAKRLFGRARQTLFSREASAPDMRVDCSLDELRRVLGDRYFTNAWELSWHYRGEDLNMRRPKRYDDDYEWYQTHVRAYERDGTVLVEMHEDLEPTAYPYYHLHPPEDSMQSEERAFMDVTEILANNGIGFETL